MDKEGDVRQGTRGRRAILAVGAAYAIGLLLLAVALHAASPGPDTQVITGVSIGRHDGEGGIAYLSGRRLACAPTVHVLHTSRCTIPIAGEELEILAARARPDAPNPFTGVCQARHAGREWPCRIVSRHLHVHWFAALEEPVGLSADDLASLRWTYPVENASEETFLLGIVAVPVLTALVAMLGAASWLAPRKRLWAAAAATSLSGLVALVGSFALAMGLTFTFWD